MGENNATSRERARSLSAGRTRRSGNDIVQDIYDRLGVKREDMTPTSPKESEPERPVSRGRLRGRWPPSSKQEAKLTASPPKGRAESEVTAITSNKTTAAKSSPFRANKDQATSSSGMLREWRQTLNTSKSADDRFDRRDKTTPYEFKEEKKEEDLFPADPLDEIFNDGPPVRDRMRAFDGADNSNKRGAKSGAMLPNRNTGELVSGNGKDGETARSKNVPASPLSARSAPTAANKAGSLAHAFLSAITPRAGNGGASPSTPRATASRLPVMEVIPAPIDDPASEGNESVSMLSASSDDHQLSPYVFSKDKRKHQPAWMERSKTLKPATSPHHQQHRHNHSMLSMGDSTIDKLVEDRVRLRVSEIERRMEDRLQSFMQKLEDKLDAKLAALERQVQQQKRG